MRAAVYLGSGLGLAVRQLPDPVPRPGQVVVRVTGAGVCGSDVSLTAPPGPDEPAVVPVLRRAYRPGSVLGHEWAGPVVAVGDGVDVPLGAVLSPMAFAGCAACARCRAGLPQRCRDRRQPMGGFAEYAVADVAFSTLLPDEVPPHVAALTEPVATALHAWRRSGGGAGSKVAVVGAGVVGAGVIACARAAGAGPIVAVARSGRNAGLASELGAETFLNAAEATPDRIADALSGRPDVVVEAAGAAGAVSVAVESVRVGGTVVVAGITLSREPVSHGLGVVKGIDLRYASAYTRRDFLDAPELLRTTPALDGLVAHRVSLAELVVAFGRPAAAAGKLIVDPWQGAAPAEYPYQDREDDSA